LYEYDDAGRLVSSRPEVEWDETEVAWMLALADYEASLCPRCGMPREICQSPDTEGRVTVPAPSRCHVTTAILGAQKGYAENEHPTALLFGAHVPNSTQ
jgi:hypothetical protein